MCDDPRFLAFMLPPPRASAARLRAMATRILLEDPAAFVEAEEVCFDMLNACGRLHDDDRAALRALLRGRGRGRIGIDRWV